jgi:2-hydroxychromene-2-carboxylate isomerase
MPSDVEFWFDFSSPYAYFAALTIDERLGRLGRKATWRPFLLGAAYQTTKMTPLTNTPMRGDYAKHDWNRLAKAHQVPFALPSTHPYRSQTVARIFYWLDDHRRDQAVAFAKAVFRAHFEKGCDMNDRAILMSLVELPQRDLEELEAWLESEGARTRLKQRTSEALDKGVFGSPFFIADGEPFWGWDRLDLMERWLKAGSWGPALLNAAAPCINSPPGH